MYISQCITKCTGHCTLVTVLGNHKSVVAVPVPFFNGSHQSRSKSNTTSKSTIFPSDCRPNQFKYGVGASTGTKRWISVYQNQQMFFILLVKHVFPTRSCTTTVPLAHNQLPANRQSNTNCHKNNTCWSSNVDATCLVSMSAGFRLPNTFL